MPWTTSLPQLPARMGRDSSVDTVEFSSVPKSFSFSTYLSPSPEKLVGPLVIAKYGEPISSTEVTILALNEECYGLRKGAFYSLPAREDKRFGHPCDVIFVPATWAERDIKTWENMGWEERLRFFKAKTNNEIRPGEGVIPICVRILKCEANDTDSDSSTSSNDSTTSSGSHSTISDPAIASNAMTYSRPTQDQSTYVLLYKTQYSTPTLCLSTALEHPSLTARTLTPADLSETFDLKPNHAELDFDWTTVNNSQLFSAMLAGQEVETAGVASNKEVVLKLWMALHGEAGRSEAEENAFGRVTRMWQELLNEVETLPYIRELPVGWPMR